MTYLLVFLSMFAADFAWTKYNMESAAKHPHRAAFWSMLIVAFGAFNIVSYTTNRWLLIPALLGAYAGTWYAVWREARVAQRPVVESLECRDKGCTAAYDHPRHDGRLPPFESEYRG